jgi:hypothetical protein
LQGLLLIYIAEAYYQEQSFDKAIYMGCLGMYWLHEIGAIEWRQSASLLTVIQGRNSDEFNQILINERPSMIKAIGVEGYEYIKEILTKYQQGN